MKIKINILPDAQKEKINQGKKIGKILKIGVSLIVALALLNVILFMFQTILVIELQAARKASEFSLKVKKGEKDEENIFQETGIRVATLSKNRSEIPHWARIMSKVSELCPESIRLDNILVQENQLKIAGFSKTREAFLIFQEKLKGEGLEVPLNISNLVASRDLDFELEITIPKDYLNQE